MASAGELLATSAAAIVMRKSMQKNVWENEGPISSPRLPKPLLLVPATAIGGLLDVKVVDIKGLTGPYGLNMNEPPYLQLHLGGTVHCSEAAGECSGKQKNIVEKVAGPGSMLSKLALSKIGLHTTAYLQRPQAFVFTLKEDQPLVLQMYIFSRRYGSCERLVAICHVSLSHIFAKNSPWISPSSSFTNPNTGPDALSSKKKPPKARWHTVNYTLVSRTKGTPPAHVSLNIGYTPPLKEENELSPSSTLEFPEP